VASVGRIFLEVEKNVMIIAGSWACFIVAAIDLPYVAAWGHMIDDMSEEAPARLDCHVMSGNADLRCS